MKKLLCVILCAGASMQAMSVLEEAILSSDVALVKRQLDQLFAKDLPSKEKQELLKRAYFTASDVVQEVNDTIEVWNSWSDIGKVWIGFFSSIKFVENIVDRRTELVDALFCDILWAVGCYIGIRGLQCKAQQYRLHEPRKIKQLVEQAIQTFDEKE